MKKYIIVAESGADLSREMIENNDIRVPKMHVEIDGKDYLDGDVSMEELTSFYDKTGKVPKTAGVNPDQFEAIFKQIKEEDPNSTILHICYSAQLSIGFQSSVFADDGSIEICRVDAKNVSIGHAFVVMQVAEYIKENPEAQPEELQKKVEEIASKTRFAFLPGNLDYLRAGGRVSNAQYLGASLLRLKPLIEVIDGLMISTKKYSGAKKKIIRKMLNDYFTRYNIDKEKVFLVYAVSIDTDVRAEVEEAVREAGVKEFVWLKTGSVITSHCGPGGVGIAGIEK
ncbi:MAG: DegV family protein [Clostridiales bacterium]|nr:DegV family protein [Clostridiales bacterium]